MTREDRIRRRERALARLDYERSCLFDLDGNLLVQVEGQEASVALPVELLEEHMPACVSSHNHPARLLTGTSRSANYRHSKEDWVFVSTWRPVEDRVVFEAAGATWVCRLRGVCRLRPREMSAAHDELEDIAARELGVVRCRGGRCAYALPNGREAGVDRLMELDDVVSRRLARAAGLDYTRFRIA